MQRLFTSYQIIELIPTGCGVADTTYLANSKTDKYILKRYERDIDDKIIQDIKFLNILKSHNLNTPVMLTQKNNILISSYLIKKSYIMRYCLVKEIFMFFIKNLFFKEY